MAAAHKYTSQLLQVAYGVASPACRCGPRAGCAAGRCEQRRAAGTWERRCCRLGSKCIAACFLLCCASLMCLPPLVLLLSPIGCVLQERGGHHPRRPQLPAAPAGPRWQPHILLAHPPQLGVAGACCRRVPCRPAAASLGAAPHCLPALVLLRTCPSPPECLSTCPAPHAAAYGWPVVVDQQGVYRRVEGEAPPIVHQLSEAEEVAQARTGMPLYLLFVLCLHR